MGDRDAGGLSVPRSAVGGAVRVAAQRAADGAAARLPRGRLRRHGGVLAVRAAAQAGLAAAGRVDACALLR